MKTTGTVRHERERETTAEDLGEDVAALAVAAAQHGRASMLRRVNGALVRLTVETLPG